MRAEIIDAEESEPINLTESELVDWQKKEFGGNFVCHRGRFWRRSRIGFFYPVHFLARFKAYEATCPSMMSLGFRAPLTDDSVGLANSVTPVYLLSDLAGYDFKALPAKRRADLKKCRKNVRMVRLKGMAISREEIWHVVESSGKRTGYWPPEIENYRGNIERHFADGRRFILAGLVGGKLAGFLEGFAADATAYIQYVFIATEYLPSAVGTGLIFEFAQACRRTGKIREISYGPHIGGEKLGAFKEGMGFPLTRVPTMLSMNSLTKKIMGWLFPKKFPGVTTGNNIRANSFITDKSNINSGPLLFVLINWGVMEDALTCFREILTGAL